MRSFLALAVLAALLATVSGCSQSSAADQIVGTWTLDPDAMKNSEEYKNSTPEEKQMAEMMFASMKMEMTFTKTDVRMDMDMMGNKETETKPYTVKSEKGSTLVLSTKDDNGMDESVTVTVGADTLTFEAEGNSFTMRRKKP